MARWSGRRWALLMMWAWAWAGSALAGADPDRGSGERAIALVHKAAAYVKQAGARQALAEFSIPHGRFTDGTMYIVVHDGNGVCLAHGATPKIVGSQLIELQDNEGLFVVKKFIAVANGPTHQGWVDYKWPRPGSNHWERKRAYIEKTGELLISSGYFP